MSDEKDSSSGFSALSRAFKANPTIEHYVELRRKYPDEVIEVAISGSIEWLFANESLLKTFDIPPELVASSLDADPVSISKLSLIIMERLIERNNAEKAGKTHLSSRGEAISDSLANYLINMMLDSLDWNDDLFIPRDLIVLIRHQIGGETSDWNKKLKTHENRSNAVWIAFQLAQQGHMPSYREIGKMLGVNATTVMRWFPNNELTERMKKMGQLFDLTNSDSKKR